MKTLNYPVDVVVCDPFAYLYPEDEKLSLVDYEEFLDINELTQKEVSYEEYLNSLSEESLRSFYESLRHEDTLQGVYFRAGSCSFLKKWNGVCAVSTEFTEKNFSSVEGLVCEGAKNAESFRFVFNVKDGLRLRYGHHDDPTSSSVLEIKIYSPKTRRVRKFRKSDLKFCF